MKKLMVMVASIFSAVVALTGCSDKGFKVVQDRVIEVTFDSFDMEKGASYLNKYDVTMGACSAVKVPLNGKIYVGRNYDFYCSDAPAVIVRNNSGKIRTIGICNSPASFDPWTDAKSYKIRDAVKTALPFLCCDVMSEKGIYAETNIRPYEKQLECVSTNPGKPRRCTQTFMQTMLTQYSTIAEIIEHLNDYDWFDLQAMGFHQSFFLVDQSGYSVIIEFGGNAVHWQESNFNANFFQNKDLYAKETIGCGELRYQHEMALFDSVKEPKDIYTMMKAGAYDQFYHNEIDPDYAIPEFYSDIGYDKNSYAKDPEGARKAVKELIASMAEYSWEERVANHSWESTFTNTANVTDKEIVVHFSEHYNIDFTVKFN